MIGDNSLISAPIIFEFFVAILMSEPNESVSTELATEGTEAKGRRTRKKREKKEHHDGFY